VQRILLLMLLVAAAVVPARAESWWPQWVTVIQPDSGQVVAFLKGDAGQYHNQWWPADVKQYPFMKALAASTPNPPGTFTAAERKAAAKVALPTFYNGKVIVGHLLRKTPGGSWLVFLEYKNDRRAPENKFEGVPGKFVLVDAKTGQVKSEMRGEYKLMQADRTETWDPAVSVWQRYFMRQDGADVNARDIDNDEPLFDSPSVLSDVRELDGGWLVGGAMYLNTIQGLKRVNPSSGHTDWIAPQIGGHVIWVSLGKDRLLYVHSVYEPVVYTKELTKAASTRYSDRKIGYVTFVPTKDGLYGLTWITSTAPDGTQNPSDCAVWKRGTDEWGWLFDYSPGTMSSEQMNDLYQRKGLDATMRSRLEAGPP